MNFRKFLTVAFLMSKNSLSRMPKRVRSDYHPPLHGAGRNSNGDYLDEDVIAKSVPSNFSHLWRHEHQIKSTVEISSSNPTALNPSESILETSQADEKYPDWKKSRKMAPATSNFATMLSSYSRGFSNSVQSRAYSAEDLRNSPCKHITIHSTFPYSPNISVSICRLGHEIDDWIRTNEILDEPAVGFDVEWRPTFTAGSNTRPIALIQISTVKAALLIQSKYLDAFPPSFVQLMNSTTTLKTGVAVYEDLKRLASDFGIQFRGYLELGYSAARCLGATKLSLKDLAKEVCNIDLNKPRSVIMSNWENNVLSRVQIQYAVYDAVVASNIYEAIVARSSMSLIKPIEDYDYEKYYSGPITEIDNLDGTSGTDSDQQAETQDIDGHESSNSASQALIVSHTDSVIGPMKSADASAVVMKPMLPTQAYFRSTVMEVFYHSDLAICNFMEFIMRSDMKWFDMNNCWLEGNDPQGMNWQTALKLYLRHRIGFIFGQKKSLTVKNEAWTPERAFSVKYIRANFSYHIAPEIRDQFPSLSGNVEFGCGTGPSYEVAGNNVAKAVLLRLLELQRKVDPVLLYSFYTGKVARGQFPIAIISMFEKLARMKITASY